VEYGSLSSHNKTGESQYRPTQMWLRNMRKREHLGDPGVHGRIILRWILKKWDMGVWTVSSWLRIGTGGGRL
jgi:hypothetical protein